MREVAALARLDIRDSEAQSLAEQFTRILEQFQVLSKLDVEGVEPMTGASGLSDVERDDLPQASLPSTRILANAPEQSAGFYSVPKTIGGDE